MRRFSGIELPDPPASQWAEDFAVSVPPGTLTPAALAPAPGPADTLAPAAGGGALAAAIANLSQAIAQLQASLGGGPVGAGLGQLAADTYVKDLPPWVFPSVTSVPYDATADITIPAIGVELAIVTFTVPKGFNGVIKTIANSFIGGGFTDGTGAITWRLLQNNQAVRGKEALLNSLGSIAQPSLIGGGGFIRILENDIIQLTVLNVSIAPAGQIIAGRLSGWFYPKDEDPKSIWF